MSDKPKTFKWVIEIEVDEIWIEDGFNLDGDVCQDIAEKLIPWAYSHEVKAKVLKAPDPSKIRKAQGYEN